MKRFDIIIVGGGAVGCAIAYTLVRNNVSIALLERNPDVAMGTSGKNSAVVHSGFNNRPGSLMAKLCVEGNKRFEQLCKTIDVPYKKTGKLVVAFNDDDLAIIDRLITDGIDNGSVGLRKIGRDELRALEPNIGGIGAMLSANTAVFDPFLYTIHLCEAAIGNGVSFFMNNEVTAIRKDGPAFVITTARDEYSCDVLINAAGLYSDKVAAMAGDNSFKIYPCRGEYFVLDPEACKLISRPVYPVPRKGVGGLGVHLTTTVDGNVLIGPSAEYVDSPEDYATTGNMLDTLFMEARQLLPALTRDMLIGSYTGIRSKLVPKGEANYGDFIIAESDKAENLINLVGIESPGLTASMPIAEMVAGIITRKHPLTRNRNFVAEYKGHPVFALLSPEEQDVLIALDSNYGEIVCRCKTITKAEVKQALGNSLNVKTITAVKNRVHATMGRCQGGYCLAKIVEILTKDFGQAPQDISLRFTGDALFPGFVK